MDHQDQARLNETLHEELGDRAFLALGAENASEWNTYWAVESRWIDSRVPPAPARVFECPGCHEDGQNGHYDGRLVCQAIAGTAA